GPARRDRVPPRQRRGHAPVPRALPRPVLRQPAGHVDHERGRHAVRRHRRRRLDRPRHGRCRPMSTTYSGTTLAELKELMGRYPDPRSALLPMLHLVQSVEGRITAQGIEVCADLLGLSAAEVSGVATFYTMYKRRPMGEHHVGICTNTLCAVMGGDEIFERVS